MPSTVIPFSGFYETWHDAALDTAHEGYFQNESGEPYAGLVSRAFDLIRWHDVHVAYAKQYAAAFADEFGIAGVEFETLDSPREYNFTTDRIFVLIPDDEIARIHRDTPREHLAKVAKGMFTSYDGFASFYSPDVDDWGDLDTWDHNQRYALICAYVQRDGDEFDSDAEFSLMEDCQCNGGLDEMISRNCEEGMGRLERVYSYLRRREERARGQL